MILFPGFFVKLGYTVLPKAKWVRFAYFKYSICWRMLDPPDARLRRGLWAGTLTYY